MVGDDDPAPLSDRPEFRALAQGDARARAQATGRLLAVMHRRTAALYRVLQHAAVADAMFAVLSNDVFLLLTETTGWSDDQYASWVATTVGRLLDLGEG